MIIRFNFAAGILTLLLFLGSARGQISAQILLDNICNGVLADSAEQQLEVRGSGDIATRQMLSAELPSLLSKVKSIKSVVLLAKLSGALQLVSTVPALSDLLTSDKSKPMMMATLYQTEELIDDPVGAALVQIGNPSVLPVSGLLQSSDMSTRRRAVRVLTKIRTPDAVAELRRANRSEQDEQIRALIQSGLKQQLALPSVKGK